MQVSGKLHVPAALPSVPNRRLGGLQGRFGRYGKETLPLALLFLYCRYNPGWILAFSIVS
jgi:hypothetical protein